MNVIIDTNSWERSSLENWSSPTSDSLKMLQNLAHDYIVSDVEFANYTISSNITPKGADDDGIGVVFDYIDSTNYKYVMYQAGGLTSGWAGNFGTNSSGRINALALFEVKAGVHSRIAQSTTAPYWVADTSFSMKLENIFDDVFFYINDVELLRYKKKDTVSGKIGFVTYSQIADFNNIKISKALTNRAKAKFKLYAVDDNDINAEIQPSFRTNGEVLTEITPIVKEMNEVDTEIFAIYGGSSNVLVEIRTILQNNVDTEIDVRPHNRMYAKYEIQQPPVITNIFSPTQDSFTREQLEFQSINYGSSNSMAVGNSATDIWRSFVQFDVSTLNPSYVLVESYLRLYYKEAAPLSMKLEVLNANKAWQEYNITNINKPDPIRLISNDFTVNEEQKYIEFDVFEVVKKWLELSELNNGFIVRASIETANGQVSFGTRESLLPPELVTRYYDSAIFSSGRSQVPTEILAILRANDDVWVEIEPSSLFQNNEIETEIYCHVIGVPVDNEINAEITVSVPDIEVSIQRSFRENSEISAEVGVIGYQKDDVNTVVSINRDTVLVELQPILRSELPTEISIKREEVLVEISPVISKENEIGTEIEVNPLTESLVKTSITATKPLVLVEISINSREKNEIFTEIRPSRPNVQIDITSTKPNVLVEISPVLTKNQDLYTIISPTKDNIWVEISVRYDSEINIEIESILASMIKAELVATKPSIWTEITAIGFEVNDVFVELLAGSLNQIETEIYVKHISNIDVELKVYPVSKLNVDIVSNRPKVFVELTVPYTDVRDINIEIQPRIFTVNNVNTVITVGGGNFGYAFII